MPDIEPGPDQVLVEVHHAGVAFPDALQSRGLYQYRPDPPFTPGSEVAGVVRSAPEGSGLEPGTRVAAFPGLGGFAELVACGPEAAKIDLPFRILQMFRKMVFETKDVNFSNLKVAAMLAAKSCPSRRKHNSTYPSGF